MLPIKSGASLEEITTNGCEIMSSFMYEVDKHVFTVLGPEFTSGHSGELKNGISRVHR